MKQDIKRKYAKFLMDLELVVKMIRKIMLNFRKEKKLKEVQQHYIQ